LSVLIFLEGVTMSDEQTQQADDPSGPGWREVGPDELLQAGDVYPIGERWEPTASVGAKARVCGNGYRRRIEPQPQPSDSEPETMEQLRRRLAVAVRQNVELADELEDVRRSKAAHQRIAKASVSRAQEAEALLAEADRGGEQVNAELQQLRQQVRDLTQELKDKSDTYQICLRNHYKAGQRSAIDRLQTWLRPVLKVVDNHPEFGATLAVTVLGFLTHIADRLIEE
jgi:hypothetical protein